MATTFDKASLVMIPSGYKDDKLYSIKPTDGSGDFTFSRDGAGASPATRVNASGLIEKGRENLLLQSNTFSNASWAKFNVSATSGQSGYDGTNDAWLITATGADGNVNQNNTSTGVLSLSCYMKAGTASWGRLRFNNTSSADKSIWVNLSSGTIGVNDDGIASSIESIGSGWYRVTIQASTTDLAVVQIYPADADGSNSSSNSIYIQDAQLESGLVATDYIETTTAPVSAGLLGDMPRLDYSGGATCPSLLLEPSRVNFIPHSEYFGDWGNFRSSITANDATSPENYTNSYKLIQQSGETTSGGIFKGISVATSTAYTYSFFAKAAGYNWCYARVIHSSDNFDAWFDLDNGVVGNTTGSGVTSSIEDYGSGWYKCSITYTSTTTLSNLHIYIADSNGSGTLSNPDGVKGIHIYGAQLEQGSYATSYIPTYGSASTRGADSCSKTGVSSLIGQTEGTLFLEAKALAPALAATAYVSITNSTASNRIIIGVVGGSGNFLRIVGISGGVSNGGNNYAIADTASYFKVAVKYSNSSIDIFINGVKKTSQSFSAFSASVDEITFDDGNGALPFLGDVKQRLLFPTALTDAECIALTTI